MTPALPGPTPHGNNVNSSPQLVPKAKCLRKEHLTDVGNARRLVRVYGQDLRHCEAFGRWLTWSGNRWLIDNTDEITRRAKATLQEMYAVGSTINDPQERTRLMGHALASESERSIRSTINLAKSEPGIAVSPCQLDCNPLLINCLNGTLDLRTVRLRPHDRQDLLVKLAPVEYDPMAMCPTFDKFLARIMGGDRDLMRYVQRCVGYSLTGDVSEKAMFFLHGEGDNGKTTLLEAIRQALGDYAGQVPIETLMVKQSAGTIPNDVAQLQGLRFVTSSETEFGQRLAEARIKYLTGMGMIKARYLYKEHFEFPPTHKIWMDANHKPVIRGTDRAIWGRVKLIPFNVAISEEEKDKHLLDKLKAESNGIFAWAVRGCQEWQRHGLGEPEHVTRATAGYREEMDTLGDFLRDCCDVQPGLEVTAKEVYAAYKSWCEDTGEHPMSQKELGTQLRQKDGLQPHRDSRGRFWKGLGLKADL